MVTGGQVKRSSSATALGSRRSCLSLASTPDIVPVVDAVDVGGPFAFVDPVDDSVRSDAGTVPARQLSLIHIFSCSLLPHRNAAATASTANSASSMYAT